MTSFSRMQNTGKNSSKLCIWDLMQPSFWLLGGRGKKGKWTMNLSLGQVNFQLLTVPSSFTCKPLKLPAEFSAPINQVHYFLPAYHRKKFGEGGKSRKTWKSNQLKNELEENYSRIIQDRKITLIKDDYHNPKKLSHDISFSWLQLLAMLHPNRKSPEKGVKCRISHEAVPIRQSHENTNKTSYIKHIKLPFWKKRGSINLQLVATNE